MSWNQGHCPSVSKKKDDREFVLDNVTGSHLLVTISCPNLSNLGFPQPDIPRIHMGGQEKEAGAELDEDEHVALLQ